MPKIERPKIVSGGGKIVSGGGISSNKLVRVGVRTGPANTNKISPRGVSQLGYATGSMMKGPGSFSSKNSALPINAGVASQVPSGNAVAASTVCGVGGSRTVYKTGTQMLHGKVAGPAPIQGREILGAFGPETSNRGSLVRK
jgi:hypothetical protein